MGHSQLHACDFNRFWSRELEGMATEQILRWTIDSFGPRLALATSFEPNGCVLTAMLSTMISRIDVIETNFGYPLYDTYFLKSMLQKKYNIKLHCRNETENGERRCHFDAGSRSCSGLKRYLSPKDFATIRHYSSPYAILICGDTRQQLRHDMALPIMEWDAWLRVAKIYPLARWTKDSLWDKIDRESIPYSTFFDKNSAVRDSFQRDFIPAGC